MFLKPGEMTSVRIRKDIAELQRQRFNSRQASTVIELPEGEHNMQKVRVTIRLTGGTYEGGTFTFHLDIPSSYPFQPPLVTCLTRIWHPNIDLSTGKVLLPILEKDWRPVLSINAVVFGLQLLFLEPNTDYAANAAAAAMYARDHEFFKTHVRETLDGGIFFGLEFPCHPRHHHHHHQQTQPHHHHHHHPQQHQHQQHLGFHGSALQHHHHQQQQQQQQHPPSPSLTSLKRKCGMFMSSAGGAGECFSPPDSDLEAMCIQDPLEEQQQQQAAAGGRGGDGGDLGGVMTWRRRDRGEQEERGGSREGMPMMMSMMERGDEEPHGGLDGSRKRPCLSPQVVTGAGASSGAPPIYCDMMQQQQPPSGEAGPMGSTLSSSHRHHHHHHPPPSPQQQQQQGLHPFSHAAAFMPYGRPSIPSPHQHHRAAVLMMPAAGTRGSM